MAKRGDPASAVPVIDLTKPLDHPSPGGQPRPSEPAVAAGAILIAEEHLVVTEAGRVFDQDTVVVAKANLGEAVAAKSIEARPHRPAPYSIWRRMALAEARQIELDLKEATTAGNPYPTNPHYDYEGYVAGVRFELEQAKSAIESDWSAEHWWTPIRLTFRELLRVWTGSENETTFAALHRASGLLLLILPDAAVRSEALKLESIFKDTKDIPQGDPRHQAYTALFDRIDSTGVPKAARGRRDAPPEPACVDLVDRGMLRELRRSQNESWEIARSRIRIFRNILSGTIPLLTGVLVAIALVSWANPNLIPLRPSPVKPQGADVALICFVGAFGGLLSAVASVRALRNFQRFYGLPLAQTILKLPAGAATALAGIVLLQDGLLGISAVSWEKVTPYALAFGIAQIAATKQIDSRASDLLGDANAKSSSTAQTSSTSAGSGDIA